MASSSVTDIYLGQGIALAARGEEAGKTLRFPPTLPLARALPLVRQQAPGLLAAGTRVRVRLSPAFCLLVRFDVPDGIRSWRELEALASARSADALGVPATQLVVEIDGTRPGWAAAMPIVVKEAVREWCEQGNLLLRSLAPLWSDASQCAAVSATTVRGCVVREPDGATELDDASNETQTRIELAFQLEATAAAAAGAPAFLRSHWVVA